MSFVQSTTTEGVGAGSTIAGTLNGVVTGNTLVVHVTWGTDVLTDFSTVTDGTNDAKWTIDKKVSSGHSQSGGEAYAVNVTGGNLTVTCNLLNTPTFRGLILEEHSAASAFDKSAMQLQVNPGGGGNAITSGATTATAGGFATACTNDVSPSTDTFTKGTGFTDGTAITDSGNVAMKSEWLDSCATNQAGTFTGAAGTGTYVTGVMTFTPGGDTLRAQVCL